MRRRDMMLALSAAALAACTPPTPGKTDAPDTAGGRAMTDPAMVIRQLYDRYTAPDGTFPEFRDQAPWSNSLWAELEAMVARSNALNEPILDFDPIIGAQDYQLTSLNVVTEAISEASHSVVRASFNNATAHTEIVYDLFGKMIAGRLTTSEARAGICVRSQPRPTRMLFRADPSGSLR